MMGGLGATTGWLEIPEWLRWSRWFQKGEGKQACCWVKLGQSNLPAKFQVSISSANYVNFNVRQDFVKMSQTKLSNFRVEAIKILDNLHFIKRSSRCLDHCVRAVVAEPRSGVLHQCRIIE